MENQTQPARQRPAELPRPRGRSRHRRAAGPRGALSAPRCGSREEHCRGAFVRPAGGPLRPGGARRVCTREGDRVGPVTTAWCEREMASSDGGRQETYSGSRCVWQLSGNACRPAPGRSRGAENCSPFLPTEGNDRPQGSLRLLLRLGRSSRGFAVAPTHSGLAGPFSNSPLYQSVLNRDGSHQTQSEK